MLVTLHLLGTPAWRVPGGEPQPLSPKDAALLAVLALDGPQSRDALCALLWPETGSAQAAASLRQRRKRLHAATGADLVRSGNVLQLSEAVEVDALRLGSLSAEALLACGPLLAGLEFGGQGELEDWLRPARARMAEALAQALATQAEARLRNGALHEALPLALRIVALTPMQEHAWRRLMRLHYLRGDRSAALEVYERLCALLREELGTQPSPETLQLGQTIQCATASPPLPQLPVPASVMLPPVMVGRDADWHAMAGAWQQQRPFVLIGEAGLGKSRLLQEFLHGREGVVLVKARPGDREMPYAVLGSLLWELHQRLPVLLPEATRRELAAIHPGLGLPWPLPSRPAVLRQAVVDFLHAAVAAGLRVLALDDMHDSDLATLELLRWLVQGTQRGAFQLAVAMRPPRDEPLRQQLQGWLSDSQPPVRVLLEPLSQAALSALLATLALPQLVDPAVSAQLFRHAGGHPLFTLATLQDALTHGRDLRQSKLPAPSSVQALLDARLAELPEAAQGLLRVAAVGGTDLSAARAAALMGCTSLALAEPWQLLETFNVLRGENFTHDLVHEAALRAVPMGLRLDLHRRWAAVLQQDPRPPLARVAWHWEHGERWAEAGQAWQEAAAAARRAGRLAEQTALFERAAGCHARAGNTAARFDALLARLDGLLLHQGGAAVLAVMPELDALAETTRCRLRCRLARAEAWIDGDHGPQALQETQPAVEEAQRHADLRTTAAALHAIALAQCQHDAQAEAAARRALAAAAADTPDQLRATHALAYVLYRSGRLADAVPVQRDAVVLAERLGDRSEAAACEGHVAALLASVGDVPGTHHHASNAHRRHAEVGLGHASTAGIVNHFTRGAAAAYLGRFGEALDALQTAVALSAESAVPAARAKSGLGLAAVWLTLGEAAQARQALKAVPDDLPLGLQIQAAWLAARAAALDGAPQHRHWLALGRLAAGHAALPLVQSAWYEVSFQGEPVAILGDLARVRAECQALGLHGTARSLHLRELLRWLELEGSHATAQAVQAAQALMPYAVAGMSAKVYPPQACLALAQAFERGGLRAQQADCLSAGRQWLAQALPSVPPGHRHAFLANNPSNRVLLPAANEGR